MKHTAEAEPARSQQPQPFVLRDARFHGGGLQRELAEGGWERVRDAI